MRGEGSLRRALRVLAADGLDMLLDRRCPGCGRAPPREREVCDECDARVGRSGVPLCLRCLHGDPPIQRAATGCALHGRDRLLLAGPRFEPPLDRILHAFKYEGGSSLAPWVASLLPEPPELRGGLSSEYVLVPVSLHPARRAGRGFDQAALLAREASARWRVPVVDCLRRIRNHPPQARCDPDARRVNVAGAFAAAAGAAVRSRCVLLVDDVATTGSTLLAAAEALEEAGAAWVLSLTAAHGGSPGGDPQGEVAVGGRPW